MPASFPFGREQQADHGMLTALPRVDTNPHGHRDHSPVSGMLQQPWQRILCAWRAFRH